MKLRLDDLLIILGTVMFLFAVALLLEEILT